MKYLLRDSTYQLFEAFGSKIDSRFLCPKPQTLVYAASGEATRANPIFLRQNTGFNAFGVESRGQLGEG